MQQTVKRQGKNALCFSVVLIDVCSLVEWLGRQLWKRALHIKSYIHGIPLYMLYRLTATTNKIMANCIYSIRLMVHCFPILVFQTWFSLKWEYKKTGKIRKKKAANAFGMINERCTAHCIILKVDAITQRERAFFFKFTYFMDAPTDAGGIQQSLQHGEQQKCSGGTERWSRNELTNRCDQTLGIRQLCLGINSFRTSL